MLSLCSDHRAKLWRTLIFATAMLWAGGGSAAAAKVSVGLLGIDGASVEPGMGQALTETLYRHIPTLQGMRVEKSQQDLVEVKLVFGCTDESPACMAKVGKSLGVNRLIYGSIRRQPQPGLYTVAIKQLNVADSTVEKFISDAVPPEVIKPDSPQLDELVQRWLRVLLIEGLRGGLRVISEPAGATVQLDGVLVGQTPLNLVDIDVGDHLLKVELAGHASIQRSIRIRGGQIHEVTATLPRRGIETAGPASPMAYSRALRITSYVAAGLAGASILAAIGTWRGYLNDEDGALAAIDQLQVRLTRSGEIGKYRDFFTSSAQLSNCKEVPGLMGDIDYRGYFDACQHGNTLARATTGLWVVAGGFAVLSVTTALLASLRHPAKATVDGTPPVVHEAPSRDAAPAATPDDKNPPAPPSAPASDGAEASGALSQAAAKKHGLMLLDIAPSIGPDGASVSASFRF